MSPKFGVTEFDEERRDLHGKSIGLSGGDPFRPGLNGELEGCTITMTFDGEFDTAPLTRSWGPGGLPEFVSDAVVADNRCFRDSDDPRSVAW